MWIYKITNIQNNNTYDDYTIDSDRAEWKEVLAIYTVKISKGTNETDVITLDDNKIAILKAKLLKKLGLNTVYYINSPQTLPPPLSKEEEEK